MQFIVRPTDQYGYMQMPRQARPLLYLLAFGAFFTSGLMVGVTWMWDGGGNNGISQPNLKLPCIEITQVSGSSEAQHATSHANNNKGHSVQSQSSVPPTESFLVILITTAATYTERRDAIRQTWLSYVGNRSRVLPFFTIGTRDLNDTIRSQLTQENLEHRDLLLLAESGDGYEHLTEKLLKSLTWLGDSNHMRFSYLLKVDDDSFVQLDHLVDLLSQAHLPLTMDRLYWGYFDGRARTKTGGKWFESSWFLCDRYLPYALGGGYVLSSDLVKYLAAAAPLLQQYKSEDVSLGTWLAPLKISRVHDIRFDTEFMSRGCSNAYLVTHKHSSGDMHDKFTARRDLGGICGTVGEKNVRKSYQYDWTQTGLDCCKRNIVDHVELREKSYT